MDNKVKKRSHKTVGLSSFGSRKFFAYKKGKSGSGKELLIADKIFRCMILGVMLSGLFVAVNVLSMNHFFFYKEVSGW